MDNSQILSHVDHTLLTPTAAWEEIKTLCEDAITYGTASVCVAPSYVKSIKEHYNGKLNICTVIGFPLGYSETSAKAAEIKKALVDGASEFDMVVNLTDVKNSKFDKVLDEIKTLKQVCGEKILKVIIETCYLTEDEKIKLCQAVTQAGADYIKTSTGFGTAGATMADVLLFKEHIGSSVKIKAAGGIRSRQDMVDYINAGCSRLGTSSAIKILNNESAGGY